MQRRPWRATHWCSSTGIADRVALFWSDIRDIDFPIHQTIGMKTAVRRE